MAAPSLKVKEIYKTLGTRAVLRGLNLTLKAGEVTALIGQNGVGKTTLLRLMAGVLEPDKGQVLYTGKNQAYLAENTPLHDHLTAADYLHFFARLHNRSTADIQNMIERTGIGHLVNMPIGRLSRGQRQLVGLAITLLPSPDLLLLDEPTSGLDPVQRGRMHKLLSEEAKNRIILLSTHGLEEAKEFCQRMILLHDGVITIDGKPADVLKSKDLRAAFTPQGEAAAV